MRLSLITSYLLLITCARAQVAQIAWDVQQDRPVAHDVFIWQGETVDLLPRLVQGTSPVAVTNTPVEFRYREASLPTNTYRNVNATANTNSGVLAVRWTPDLDAGAPGYDYQIIVGSNEVNPRVFGRITMRPTIGWPPSTNAPPPVTLYPTRAELQAASNALAQAVQDLAFPVSSVNGQTGSVVITASAIGALEQETDAIAIAALATNRVTRWYDSKSGLWWQANGGTNLVSYRVSVVGRNFTVHFLSGGLVSMAAEYGIQSGAAFPFTKTLEDLAPFVGAWDEMGHATVSMSADPVDALWSSSGISFPQILLPIRYASGTGRVDAAEVCATNIVGSYNLSDLQMMLPRQNGFATNLNVRGTFNIPNVTTYSNGMQFTVGRKLNGTNGVYWTDPTGVTNAWILLPW